MLGVGRAAAETAALIFTSGYVDRMPESLLDSGRSLSIHIYDLSMNVPGGDANAYASALVLLGLLLTINLTASLISSRFSPRRGPRHMTEPARTYPLHLADQGEATPVPASIPGGPMIRTCCLSVAYRRRPAVSDVDLEVRRGSVTAVIGPSGCGKSSFLASLNRMTDLVPGCSVTGSVRIDDLDVFERGCDPVALRRRVGMIFQKPNPFPTSILKNLTLPLKEHGLGGFRSGASGTPSPSGCCATWACGTK